MFMTHLRLHARSDMYQFSYNAIIFSITFPAKVQLCNMEAAIVYMQQGIAPLASGLMYAHSSATNDV